MKWCFTDKQGSTFSAGRPIPRLDRTVTYYRTWSKGSNSEAVGFVLTLTVARTPNPPLGQLVYGPHYEFASGRSVALVIVTCSLSRTTSGNSPFSEPPSDANDHINSKYWYSTCPVLLIDRRRSIGNGEY